MTTLATEINLPLGSDICRHDTGLEPGRAASDISQRTLSRRRSVAHIGADRAMNREAGVAREYRAEFRAVHGPGAAVQEPVPTGKAV